VWEKKSRGPRSYLVTGGETRPQREEEEKDWQQDFQKIKKCAQAAKRVCPSKNSWASREGGK